MPSPPNPAPQHKNLRMIKVLYLLHVIKVLHPLHVIKVLYHLQSGANQCFSVTRVVCQTEISKKCVVNSTAGSNN